MHAALNNKMKFSTELILTTPLCYIWLDTKHIFFNCKFQYFLGKYIYVPDLCMQTHGSGKFIVPIKTSFIISRKVNHLWTFVQLSMIYVCLFQTAS